MNNYEERKEKWNLNKGFLRNWISEKDSSFNSLEDQVKEGLKKIIGKSGIRQSSSNLNENLRNLFLEKKEISGKELYLNYDIGFPGMMNFCKSQLSRKDSESWIWIEYDSKEKIYSLKGKGSEIPENFKGWIPKEMRIL